MTRLSPNLDFLIEFLVLNSNSNEIMEVVGGSHLTKRLPDQKMKDNAKFLYQKLDSLALFKFKLNFFSRCLSPG